MDNLVLYRCLACNHETLQPAGLDGGIWCHRTINHPSGRPAPMRPVDDGGAT